MKLRKLMPVMALIMIGTPAISIIPSAPVCDLEPDLLKRLGTFVKNMLSPGEQNEEKSGFRTAVETVLNTTQGAAQITALLFLYYLYNNYPYLGGSQIASMMGKIGGLSAFSNPEMAWSLLDRLVQGGKNLAARWFPGASVSEVRSEKGTMTSSDSKEGMQKLAEALTKGVSAEKESKPRETMEIQVVEPFEYSDEINSQSTDVPEEEKVVSLVFPENITNPQAPVQKEIELAQRWENNLVQKPSSKVIQVPKEVVTELLKKAKDLQNMKVGRKTESDYENKIQNLKTEVAQWIQCAQGAAPHASFETAEKCGTATQLKEILKKGMEVLKSLNI